MRILRREFYSRDTVEVAKDLLGKYLVRQIDNDLLIGKIVEVEAYKGSDDPASHAYRGKTTRNTLMFGEAGHAYIYFIYGKHHCLNVTTEKVGTPGAVLIRALEPIFGIEFMKKNRKSEDLVNLTNGPGKLTEAMKITKKLNGWDLTRGERLFVCEPALKGSFRIKSTTRVGIREGVDKPWRFYVEGNKFVSKGNSKGYFQF